MLTSVLAHFFTNSGEHCVLLTPYFIRKSHIILSYKLNFAYQVYGFSKANIYLQISSVQFYK